MDTNTATTDELHAASRIGWKADDLRAQADALEAGTHEVSAYMPAAQVPTVAAAWRAEADQIAADEAAADAELDRRRRARKPFAGYVA